MGSVWTELKRRNVVRVGLAYVIVGWLVLQLTDVLVPLLNLPEWAGRLVFLFLLIGFPIALFFAWAYELTPEGLKREKDVDRSASVTHQTGRKLDFLIIGVLGIAVVYLVAEKLFWAEEESTGTLAVAEQSVAVLPFVNMSADPDQEYFSDGIAEELLNQLSKLRDVQVAGRTSSFAFKGQNEDLRVIGEKLNVANVLEGSVRKAGNRVRITAQLIKVKDGYHLWSETYERDLTDIFGIQEEIAKAVASALSIALGVGGGDVSLGGTRNFDAYDAYLAGLSLTRQIQSDSTVQAIQLLEKAVALDPNYAQAWSVLAQTYQNAADFFFGEQTDELYKKSEAAATRAIEIAPEAIAPLVAAAQVQMRNHDWKMAEQSFKKALALAPANYEANLYFGQFLMNVGRPRESLAYSRQAANTEPLLLLPSTQTGWAYEVQGNTDLAFQELERGKDLIGNQTFRQLFIAVIGMEKGDHMLMRNALEEASTAEGMPPSNTILNSTMVSLLDTPDTAKAELHRFSEDAAFDLPANHAGIAVWASYFSDAELALKTYRALYEAGEFQIFPIWRPIDKEMRRLPGFKDMLRNLGLVDYWRSTGDWGEFCRPVGHADFECK